jgi:hypothetical protein
MPALARRMFIGSDTPSGFVNYEELRTRAAQGPTRRSTNAPPASASTT